MTISGVVIFGGGGMAYVDRGDIGAWDKVLGTLTADGAWHDWDLSAIIDPGSQLVKVTGYFKADSAGKEGIFRTNGNSNTINRSNLSTQVANVYIDFEHFVKPDVNGVIEYFFSVANWAYINLAITGWFT